MAPSTATTTPPRGQRPRVPEGHEAARKPRIRLGSKPYTYHIESKTRPGIFHIVDVHRLSCNCEAGRYQRGCWHLRLALAWHDWRKRQQAAAAEFASRPTGMAALQEAVA